MEHRGPPDGVVELIQGQFTPTGPQPLSVAGLCFLTMALTFFLVNIMMCKRRVRVAALPGAARA